MSHAPMTTDSPQQQKDEYRQFFEAHSALLRSGRSFSGNERNCCFLNLKGDRFADISAIAGIDFPDDSRAVCVVDWDFDGDLDFWMLNRTSPRIRFFRNDVDNQNAFLALRLIGTSCNRDAIGARVELHLADNSRPLIHTLRAGDAYASQSSKWLHFGLGNAKAINKVVVKWPGRSSQVYRNLDINHRYILTQDDPAARIFTAPTGANRVFAAEPLATSVGTGAERMGLAGKIPSPALQYRTWAREIVDIRFPRDKPLLINLWASWCAPCVKELREFARLTSELQEHNVDVLALTVDGLKGLDSQESVASRKIIERIGSSFESGWATIDLVKKLNLLQGAILESEELLNDVKMSPEKLTDDQAGLKVIPISFLIAPNGNVAAIYPGPVDVATLLSDVDAVLAAGDEAANLAIEFPGRWRVPPSNKDSLVVLAGLFLMADYAHDSLAYGRCALQLAPDSDITKQLCETASIRVADFELQVRRLSDRLTTHPNDPATHVELAAVLRRYGRVTAAIQHCQKAVELMADCVPAHQELGSILAREGDLKAAEVHFREALRIDPNNAASREGLERIEKILHPH